MGGAQQSAAGIHGCGKGLFCRKSVESVKSLEIKKCPSEQARGECENGYQCRRRGKVEEAAPLREQGVGSAAVRGGLSAQMQGMRPSDHDCPQAPGEECERNPVKFAEKLKNT